MTEKTQAKIEKGIEVVDRWMISGLGLLLKLIGLGVFIHWLAQDVASIFHR